MAGKSYRALGLMSGTSMDGIDAALIETDGTAVTAHLGVLSLPYDAAFRERLRQAVARAHAMEDKVADNLLFETEAELTERHAEAVVGLLQRLSLAAADIDVVGFHGHTVDHRPDQGFTWQIGDGARLSRRTGIDVVCDLRGADVAAGGEGAPLMPAYHQALCASRFPGESVVMLNIGGVGNVTWLGADGDCLAFDTGPGNALLDDWVRGHTGAAMDEGGVLASRGRADDAALRALLDDAYFERPPPKSLDRDQFDSAPCAGLSVADGAATLAAFTVETIAIARVHFPAPAQRWIVTGGGRHNPAIMAGLAERLGVAVEPIEVMGFDGDVLEAEGFGYLAVRSLLGLPISFPGTTGAPRPLSGGVLHKA